MRAGLVHDEIKIHEISLVTIPANENSLITNFKSHEKNKMTTETIEKKESTTEEKVKTVGAPVVQTNKHNGQYSLQKLIQSAIQPDVDAGFEKEISQGIKQEQPWREFRGFAIPDTKVIKSYNEKASGTSTGSANMQPLLGTDYQDQLFTQADNAIGS